MSLSPIIWEIMGVLDPGTSYFQFLPRLTEPFTFGLFDPCNVHQPSSFDLLGEYGGWKKIQDIPQMVVVKNGDLPW